MRGKKVQFINESCVFKAETPARDLPMEYYFSRYRFFSTILISFFLQLEWMGLIFYDYDGLQPKITPPKLFSRQCVIPCLEQEVGVLYIVYIFWIYSVIIYLFSM
jgi:hypothetical protein